MRLQNIENKKITTRTKKEQNKNVNIVEALPFKIKDIKLAKFGRDKIDISEREMPGLYLLF